MYYRLEYPDGDGVFSKGTLYIDSKELRELRYKLPVPKFFLRKEIPPTKSWFTEYGYNKYKQQIDAILSAANIPSRNRGLRLITTEVPGEILMSGKVQIITKR